VGYVVSASGNL